MSEIDTDDSDRQTLRCGVCGHESAQGQALCEHLRRRLRRIQAGGAYRAGWSILALEERVRGLEELVQKLEPQKPKRGPKKRQTRPRLVNRHDPDGPRPIDPDDFPAA